MAHDLPELEDAEILARISPSGARRWFALAVLAVLGGLLIYLALVRPPQNAAWQIFLLGFGVLVLWLADTLRRATLSTLYLTHDALIDSDGRTLTKLTDVVGIERGFFAFKPSNGFMLKTRRAQGRTWSPGVWWRVGPYIGVGGATSAGEAKSMAHILTAMLAERG